MRWVLLVLCMGLSACTSQFSLGPAATWAAVPPAIPGFHPVPIGNGGFIEAPDIPPTVADPPIEVVVKGLSQAAAVRSYLRQLR
jgi:hypothetical protein